MGDEKIHDFICENYVANMQQINKGVKETIEMKCEVIGLKEDDGLIIHHSFVKSDIKLKLSRYFDSQHYMTFKPSDKF